MENNVVEIPEIRNPEAKISRLPQIFMSIKAKGG